MFACSGRSKDNHHPGAMGQQALSSQDPKVRYEQASYELLGDRGKVSWLTCQHDVGEQLADFAITQSMWTCLYCCCQGFVEAARAFEQEAGVAPGVELSSITNRMHVRKAVQSGEVEQAIGQVNDIDPEVRQYCSFTSLHHQPGSQRHSIGCHFTAVTFTYRLLL
jgi:hypothetical protein